MKLELDPSFVLHKKKHRRKRITNVELNSSLKVKWKTTTSRIKCSPETELRCNSVVGLLQNHDILFFEYLVKCSFAYKKCAIKMLPKNIWKYLLLVFTFNGFIHRIPNLLEYYIFFSSL